VNLAVYGTTDHVTTTKVRDEREGGHVRARVGSSQARHEEGGKGAVMAKRSTGSGDTDPAGALRTTSAGETVVGEDIMRIMERDGSCMLQVDTVGLAWGK
jgi:hypothetical protein